MTSGDLPFTVPNPHSDIDFISDLVDALVANHGVDLQGCMPWGHDLACRLNDKITGIGAVARTMYAESMTSCVVTHPTPVVTILGTNDFISNYDGVEYQGTLYYHSSDAGRRHWMRRRQHGGSRGSATTRKSSPSICTTCGERTTTGSSDARPRHQKLCVSQSFPWTCCCP